MKPNTNLTAVGLALTVVFTSAAFAADQPNAEQILGKMSAKLAATQSYSFDAVRELDPALVKEQNLPLKASISVSVQRPNKLAAISTSELGIRRFIFDGSKLSLLDEKPNFYATVPMRTSLDGLVAALDQRYGFVPPLTEFALSDVAADMAKQGYAFSYNGTGIIGGFLGLGGTKCHRIGLAAGKVADSEIWIGANDYLPRKLIVSSWQPGHPEARIAFSNWNLSATHSAGSFVFTPPAGAEKIEMLTEVQMANANKKAAAQN